MAIKLGFLLVFSIICLVFVTTTGCSSFADSSKSFQYEECIECEICELPEPSYELFKELGCVPIEDVNEIINLTNELINELNVDISDEFLISNIIYYENERGVE